MDVALVITYVSMSLALIPKCTICFVNYTPCLNACHTLDKLCAKQKQQGLIESNGKHRELSQTSGLSFAV